MPAVASGWNGGGVLAEGCESVFACAKASEAPRHFLSSPQSASPGQHGTVSPRTGGWATKSKPHRCGSAHCARSKHFPHSTIAASLHRNANALAW